MYFMTSGTANLTGNFNINAGLTYSQSGGTMNVTNGEVDFNTSTITLSGGTLNTKLVTGVNSGTNTAIFNISGGNLNLSSAANPIYGGSTSQYVNFTTGSTGVINFTGGISSSTIDNYITNSAIEYNNATAPTYDFVVTSGPGSFRWRCRRARRTGFGVQRAAGTGAIRRTGRMEIRPA